MSSLTLVLHVHGGIVQGVFASHPDVAITLVDWDVGESDADYPGVISITESLGCTQQAYVAPLSVAPLTELAGTDVEAAIDAAEFVSA